MWGSCGIFCMGAGWILVLICLWSVEFRYMYAWLCMPFCWMYPAPHQSNSFEISMRSCNWLNRKHTAAPHAQYPAFHQSIASGHDKEATSEAAIDIEIIAWKKVNIYRETIRHPVDALKIADPLAIRCSFPCMSHLFSPVLTYSHLFVYILVTTLVAVQNPLGQGKSGGRWKMIYTLYIKRGCCQKIFEWAWSAGTMFIIQWSPWELMLYMDNDHHPKGLPGRIWELPGLHGGFCWWKSSNFCWFSSQPWTLTPKSYFLRYTAGSGIRWECHELLMGSNKTKHQWFKRKPNLEKHLLGHSYVWVPTSIVNILW
jgi:hypothetical protein